MTTTLSNVTVVGSPDYYLKLESGKNSGYARLARASTTTDIQLSDCWVGYRFRLTSGDPTSQNTSFYSLYSADGKDLSVYLGNNNITFRLADGMEPMEIGIINSANLELNKWYYLAIYPDNGGIMFSLRDSAGFELANDGPYTRSFNFNISKWRLEFGANPAIGVEVYKSTITKIQATSETVLDLSDITWDPIKSTGSTNAKFSAASEPVLDTLSVTPSTSAQTLTPPSGVDGYNQVNVSAVENVLPENIKLGASILGVNGTVVEKAGYDGYNIIAPDASLPYTIEPDSGYGNCFNKVTITSITNLTSSNIKQGVTIAGKTGTVVEKNSQTKTTSLAPDDSLPYVVEPSTGYNALDSVTISGITNLTAANIKKDVQIAGVTGTYEGSGSSGVITVSAHNDKSSAVQAGQKVLVQKGVVSGVASYSIKDVTEISAPNYLKNYTFGVAVNAIPQAQGGSVVIPADMGTAIGKYVVNTAGQGHAYFNNYNVNDADFGNGYLGYATTQTGGYAQVSLPNMPYTDLGTSTITFAFKRIGSASESRHLVAKVTNSWDTSAVSSAETADVFRVYLAGDSSGYTVSLEYKKTDDTFETIAIDGKYMTSVGDTLTVTIQLLSSSFRVTVNSVSTGTSYTDLTTTENLRFYNIWNPSSNYAVEYLLAYESDGYDYIGCRYSSGSYGSGYFFGAKYYY